jgi:predicted O-methyltransferase YrrM
LVALAAICRNVRPARVVEFGTYTGLSTLTLALNTPPDTTITTIDLDPSTRAGHHHGLGIGGFPEFVPGFFFRGTDLAPKITQLYGDSTQIDLSHLEGKAQLIFIDADHTYRFVKSDTQCALRLIVPGGVILWDDYRWNAHHPECSGVTQVVEELAETLPVASIAGTRLAAVRVPT